MCHSVENSVNSVLCSECRRAQHQECWITFLDIHIVVRHPLHRTEFAVAFLTVSWNVTFLMGFFPSKLYSAYVLVMVTFGHRWRKNVVFIERRVMSIIKSHIRRQGPSPRLRPLVRLATESVFWVLIKTTFMLPFFLSSSIAVVSD